MAPRGIVAAATASTFSATLVAHGVEGAAKILPATFLVIVSTVTLYGLTAAPVARRLGIVRPARIRALLVGGDPWVLELAQALRSVGLEIVMWAGGASERERIVAAGLELADDGLVAAATGGEGELEGITAVLLLTEEDDFNALAAAQLAGNVEGPVYRLAAAEPDRGVVAPYLGTEVLFSPKLSRATMDSRHRGGATIVVGEAGAGLPPGSDLLFVVTGDGLLEPVTTAGRPALGTDSHLILLGAGSRHD